MFLTHWLGNLTLARKFLVFAILSAVLVSLPLIAYLWQSSTEIADAQRTADGLAPQQQLLQVVQRVQQHRRLAASALAGDAQAETQRVALRGEVQKAYEALTGVLNSRNPGPAATKVWQPAQSEWQALEQSVTARSVDASASSAQHSALVARLLEVLDLSSDYFGVLRAGESHERHLAMAALYHLPAAVEILAQVHERGAMLLPKAETLSALERDELVTLAALAQSHCRHLARALGKAAAVDVPYRDRLAGMASESGALCEQVMKTTREPLSGATQTAAPPSHSAADFARAYDLAVAGHDKLHATQFAVLEEIVARRVRGMRSTQLAVLAAAVLLALLAAGLSYWVMRTISRPLQQALGMARRFTSGDLTQRKGSHMQDEFGRLLGAMNTMRGELAASVTDIRIAADSVSVATGEIAHGNSDLSRRTEQQAASLQETASSMEQFTSTVKQNAENARQANALAQDAAAVALRGGEAAHGVVSTMQGIAQSSGRIADVIGVIENIAFQTNILALNAAVEAARAGEQGRGFAVVASEVRSLAQRSAQAAKEIKGLIDESSGRVGIGVRAVEDAGKTMGEIVASVTRLKDLMAEIARASAEQLSGIEQVNSAIVQMDGNTQQNAALVEQAAAAAQHLLDQAQALTESVAKFKLEEGLEAQKREAILDNLRVGPRMNLASGVATTDSRAIGVRADAGTDERALPFRADGGDRWKSL